ncbi:unnamed protein product [Choristocarpus tenellus]
MHKLTSVEAQRVIAVMEDTLDKLNLMSYVPCTSRLDLLDKLAEAGANPIKSCLQAQWLMEQSAMKMGAMGPESRTRGSPTIERGSETGNRDIISGDSLEQIYQSTRVLCRSLRKSTVAVEILLGFASQEPRPQSALQFNQYLSDLTGIMYHRLSTTVEEEAANKKLLHDLTECEKLAEDERDTLQQTLDATRTEKEREISALDATIKRLREELQEVTQTNAIEMESIKNKAGDAVAKAKKSHEEKVKVLIERVEYLTKDITEVSEAHRIEEADARKKKAKAEAELASIIAKYDRDMVDRTAAIRAIELKMDEERKDLAELTLHFDRVNANSHQRDTEEALLDAVQKRVAKAMGVLNSAVTSIQSAYRGNVQRAEYQKLKKKAKKGGKKGAKKGKKGK